MYSMETRIRYSETGPDRHLSLPGIINYFQDSSTFHSEDVSLGIDFFNSIQKVWVLNSWHLEISRYPMMGDEVAIETWPYAFKGFFGYRNFILREKTSGDVMVSADSLWIFLDLSTGHPGRLPRELAAQYQMGEKYPMETAERKIKTPEILHPETPIPVLRGHLDSNLHVNNSQYIQMAAEYLPENFYVSGMRAEYRSSAHLGDTIYPHTFFNEHTGTVMLADQAKNPYAMIEFKRKDIS